MEKEMHLLWKGSRYESRSYRIMMGAVLLLCGAAPVWAEEDLLELGFFAQEAQTVTASRRLQPVGEAPVAVEVITDEEIRASGATNLWDLIRYWRVDARLAYNPVKDLEIFVAGRNLASPNHREFPYFLEIPKSYYAGLSVIY